MGQPMQGNNVLVLESAFRIAAKSGVRTVFIYIDPLEDLIYPKRLPRNVAIILVTKRKKLELSAAEERSLGGRAKHILQLPKIPLNRASVVKIALMLALAQEDIATDGPLLFVVGHSKLGMLDCIQYMDAQKESELLTVRASAKLSDAIRPEVFQAVLNMSMELAEKGREGKPVGTCFVVGDTEKVMQLSKQMIINPFKGYPEEERNILSPSLRDTIREFSSLDGAFVVADDGTVLNAGRYLGAATNEAQLPRGLGSRHMAAAGITALTRAVAFVISESSGDVRIFKDGAVLMEIEKSQK